MSSPIASPEGGKSVDLAPDSDKLEKALRSRDLPHIYANGFANVQSNADIGLVLQQYGEPVAVVNMSFTLAKTLVQRLGSMISELEQVLDQEIAITDDVEAVGRKKNVQEK